MTDKRYFIWLSLAFKQGSAVLDTLLSRFHYNAKAIFDADPDEISKTVGEQAMRILNAERNFSRTDKIYDFCQKENIGLLTPDSKFYPSSLLRITGSPAVIYYKGRLPDFSSRPTVGVVGTRGVTPYGRSAAYTISHDLASAGAIVVSGMALGTDTAVHRGALDAKGTTVAFLGCGIDVVYPRENTQLMQEISQNGAVMTDYAPGERPEGWHFPLRNRLISGVSHGVLVVEAAMKSGAIITAEHAIQQGKLIYAVPGKVGELASTGTNNLIRQGAKMVTSSSDILSDFRGLFPSGFNADYKTQNNISYAEIPKKASPHYPKPKVSPPKQSEPPTPSDSPIIYPSEPLTEKGYTTIISEEDILKYSDIPTAEPKSMEQQASGDVAERTLYDHVNALRNLRRSKVINKAPSEPISDTPVSSSPENPKEPQKDSFTESYEAEMRSAMGTKKTAAPKEPDLEGLNESECTILKFIFEKGKASADSMSSLGIPISKLLSALTSLEIKERIEQIPGGYFIPK